VDIANHPAPHTPATESLRLAAASRVPLDRVEAARNAINVTLIPGQQALLREYVDALIEHVMDESALYIAEVSRHFPGLAPALHAVWEHVISGDGVTGKCCE
jgi:hypothetical protein